MRIVLVGGCETVEQRHLESICFDVPAAMYAKLRITLVATDAVNSVVRSVVRRWLDAWKQRLLPCAHHHIVFTLPHELNLLWRYNKKTFSSLLFQACSQSLKELLADPQFLGAIPGILSALHTWSQQLAIHVHVHALVTAGGMNADGNWTVARKSCLLPRQVLMVKFRGKMRALLLQAIDDLQLPPGKAKSYWISQLNRLGRVCWNVKLLERYDHGQGVAHYLARYLRGGPISDTRLLSSKLQCHRFSLSSTG